jgi:DNA-binding transcriptional regulator GbsR (MarR family)
VLFRSGIANKTISKQLSNLSEEDKKELQSITTLSKDDIKDEINSLKEEVSSKLKLNLNESTDSELTNAIQSTIDKVNDAKCDHYNLYKLRKLNMGL